MASHFSVVNRRRRTTGGFSPPDLANLHAWYDPSQAAGYTLVSGLVSDLHDLSGNGYDLTQATADNRPKLLLSKQFGKSIVSFDGVNDRLEGSTATLSAPYTIYIVHRSQTFTQAASDFDYYLALENTGGTDNAISIGRHDAGSGNPDDWYMWDGAAIRDASALSGHTWYITMLETTTSSPFTALKIDDVIATLDASVSVRDSNGDLALGRYPHTNVHHGTFWLGEIIIYAGEQTDDEHTQVHDYLLAKWKPKTAKALSFPSISNEICHFEAKNNIRNGADISQLTDLSGNGNHAVQATAANQPFYDPHSGDFNNEPVIDFFGSTEYLATPAFVGGALTQPTTIMICYKHDVTSGTRYLCDGIVTTDRHACWNNSSTDYGVFAGAVRTFAGTDTSKHVVAIIFNGASSKFYEDGGAALDTQDYGSHTLTGLTLGARFSATSPLNGQIAAAAVWNKALSTTEMDSVGDFWNQEYGTSWAASS